MKKTITFIFSVIFSFSLFAQNETDALRYSLINYSGTARFSGLSGAYGAVGADFSSLSQNPAGIALFRKSEFSITPLFSSNNTTNNFMGSSNTDSRNTMHLGNIGYVFSKKMAANSSPLLQLQFGFGVNMMSSFSNRAIINGYNDSSSFLNQYVNYANNNPSVSLNDWDNFGLGLAYDIYLINYDSTNQRWAAEIEGGNLQQTKTIETRGSTTETVLSAGANISDKLFLGVTFAFPSIKYIEKSNYSEKDINNAYSDFSSFSRYEYLETRGSGFNFKAGFIYKPIEFLRIGGAIHSPTNYYDMKDTYSAQMRSQFDNGDSYSKSSDDYNGVGTFEYSLKTPFRALGSIAFILGQYGLISADYEYIDYSTARFKPSGDYTFSDENSNIRSDYTAANNFRFGAEYKAGIFAFRGGYSFYGTPYAGTNAKGARTGFSLGMGVRKQGYYADFAYNHSSSESYYYLYGGAPSALTTTKLNTYSLTLGFRF